MADKPNKPREDFPLFAHATGKWAKKIKGRLHYFGKWADPDAAEREYESFIGKQGKKVDGFTVKDACNSFLTAKRDARDRRELASRSFDEYHRTCKRVIEHFGAETLVASLTPEHFQSYRTKLAERWNMVAIGNEVTRVRSLFRWCRSQRLIPDEIHYGDEFKKAGIKAQRRHRRLAGKKLFSADEIKRLLDFAGVQMRAIVFLGINCGFGPTDCATLPLSALDLKAGWIHYPRPKTEVDRDIPLWPETVAALTAVIERRYEPKPEAADRVFVQPDGQPWDTTTNPIAKHFRQLYSWAAMSRGGHYWLRHTFATVAGGSKDQIAVNALMGHADASMAAVYREEIDPARLIAVVNHVRSWLYQKNS